MSSRSRASSPSRVILPAVCSGEKVVKLSSPPSVRLVTRSTRLKKWLSVTASVSLIPSGPKRSESGTWPVQDAKPGSFERACAGEEGPRKESWFAYHPAVRQAVNEPVDGRQAARASRLADVLLEQRSSMPEKEGLWKLDESRPRRRRRIGLPGHLRRLEPGSELPLTSKWIVNELAVRQGKVGCKEVPGVGELLGDDGGELGRERVVRADVQSNKVLDLFLDDLVDKVWQVRRDSGGVGPAAIPHCSLGRCQVDLGRVAGGATDHIRREVRVVLGVEVHRRIERISVRRDKYIHMPLH